MPSIKDDSTVQAIAREYCSNGRNAEKALVAVGYAPSYARNGTGHKVCANVRVINAIAAIDAESAAKQARTIESIDDMQQRAYDLAMTIKQPSAAVSAGTAIARLYGMDKDAGVKPEPVQAPDPELEAELAAVAQRYKLRKANSA